MAQRLLTSREAAGLLGVAEGTLRNWRHVGGGPRFVRVGRAIRYRTADLERWLTARSYDRTPATPRPR